MEADAWPGPEALPCSRTHRVQACTMWVAATIIAVSRAPGVPGTNSRKSGV